MITIFLIAADATYVLIISARITGDARSWLPFNINASNMREYNEGDAYNYFDMSIFALDLIIMLLLSLSVCSESIGGLVWSLFGFALAIVLVSILTLWQLSITISVVTGLPDTVAYKLLMILYFVLPYFALFILRVYVLHKAQQFRRDIIRKQESKDIQNAGEHTRLVRDRRVGDAQCGALRAKGSADEPKTGGTVNKSQDKAWR